MRLLRVLLLAAFPAAWASGDLADVEPVQGTPVYIFPARGPSGGDAALIHKLLNEDDASVRTAAAMALSGYAATSRDARAALIKALQDRRNPGGLRRECAKSLSRAGNDQAAAEALVWTAHAGPLEDDDLRAVALKALYQMTHRQAARDALLKVLESGTESLDVVRGAAWGAFLAAGKVWAREPLLKIAKDDLRDPSLRLEAVKSLFGAMNIESVRAAMLRLAQAEGEDLRLRYGAILILITRRGDHDVRRALESLEQDEPLPALRAAAVHALYRPIDHEIAEFFHLAFVPPGHWRDPIVDE